MLSIETLRSAAQAADYYENSDYYTKEEQQQHSCWFGAGAQKLDLDGAVDSVVFEDLLNGELPNGTIMHKGYNAQGAETRRPGYDLTFSAAKSVSILAFKDPRIIDAHNKAVIATLEKIEKQASARVKLKGVVQNKITQNLVVATFLHHVSRLLDPDHHTHCVVMNMTEIEGKYRSLYGDDFYKLKKSFGLEYRLELAQNLMQLGYELEQTSKEGFFEIKGVPTAVIKQLSKRRQEIEQILQDQGLEDQQKITMVLHKGTKYERTVTTVASSMANLITRKQKSCVNIKELQEQWDQELKLVGFSGSELEDIINKSHERGPIKARSPETEIIKALPLAIKHLSDQKAVFSKVELLFTVKALCVTNFPNNSFVEKIIINHINEKELIPLENNRFTTLQAIQLEKDNISVMQQQQGTCGSILSIWANVVDPLLLHEPSKREALQMLLTTKDRFIAIDAMQELDQQIVLKAFNYAAFNCKSYVIGPRHELAQKFAQAIGLKRAFSLNGFLYYVEKLATEKQNGQLYMSRNSQVWLLQRSHMLSSKDLAAIAKYAIQLNAKVVLLGDRMRPSKAGAPFRYLLDNGMKHVNLTADPVDILTLLREKKCQDAIMQMEKEGSLIEIVDRDKRIEQAVNFSINNNAVLITQNNVDKHNVNLKIRQVMQTMGKLSGDPVKIPVLISMNLSNTQKESVANYQIGDIVRFNKGIQNSIYSQGEYFTIADLNSKDHKLMLENNNNIYPLEINSKNANKLAVYRPQARELQIGDLLVWQDNTPRNLQENSDFIKNSAQIVSITQNQQAVLILPNGKTFTLDFTKNHNQHIEYGYAQTLNTATRTDFINGAVLLNNDNLLTLSLTDIYTALSSIKEKRILFCSNIELLKQSIAQNSGLKEHAYLQKAVTLNKDLEDTAFSKAKGELEGTLARHAAMLAKIVPEINLLNTQELHLPKTFEYLEAIEAVNFAITKLSEREAIFSAQELLDTAKKYDIKIAGHLIDTAINQAISEGWLINKREYGFITKEVYAMECACLKIQKQGENVLEPIIAGPNQILDAIKDHKYFTGSQKQAILLIATSADRVNLIQGIAGSGKTSMLKEVKKLAMAAGFELLGLANTASAKNNLQIKTANELYDPNEPSNFADAGISSRTLASFLNQIDKMLGTSPELAKHTYAKNTVFILDEASLVSVRDMFLFLNIVEQLDARAIIVGDHRQLPSIEASRAFQLLLGTSNSCVVMNINTRLRTKEALQIMQDIYATRIDDAFDKLLDNLIEIPIRQERLQAMANYYLSASQQERAEIMPMLPLNIDRVDFNNLVREGLKQEGTLTGIEVTSDILVAKNLTYPETNYALSFDVGDWIKFNHSIPRLGIHKGDLLVVDVCKDQRVLLFDQNGNKVCWDPLRFAAYFKGAVEVYTQDTRNIMVGDVIRWKRNDEARGIINSETAQIIKVDDLFVEVKLHNGQLLSLDLTKKNNQHWDHAYGSTVHVVQGLDKYNPIGQGLGAAPRRRSVAQVQIGDLLIIPGNEKDKTMSKVGKVVNIIEQDGKIEIVARDRLGDEHRLFQRKIAIYPDFNKAKVPNISSLESFLVMATRGDKLVMFVDNIEGYKAAITANQDLKKTALAIMLPKLGNEIQEKVNDMTRVVYGLAQTEELNQPLKNNKENTATNNTIATAVKQKNAKPLDNTTKKILNFNEPKKQLKPRFDLNEIKQALARDVLSYVSKWRGQPKHRSGREARWGKKGSFSVVLSGPKTGTWADFEAGVAGKDLVSLYMYTFNLSKDVFPKVLEDLSKEANVSPMENTTYISAGVNQKKEQELAIAREKYINKVEKLYFGSAPIKGTLAEKYFQKYRGIDTLLPNDFKFKARCWHDELQTYKPALIVPGYDVNGKLQAVNRIYLNTDGSKLDEKFNSQDGLQQATAKRNYGPTASTTIKINENSQSDITLVTEGVENALSIKQANPQLNIISSFGVGQLKNLSISSWTKTIILCADNDGLSVNTKTPMLEAMQKWLEQGYQVKLAMPFDNNLEKKIDFNDLLNNQGVQAIDQCLSNTIKVSETSIFKNKSSSLSQDFLKLYNPEQTISVPDLKSNALGRNMEHVTEHEL